MNEVPKELMEKQLKEEEAIKQKGGKIKVGINEVTKTIERGKAKLVLIANDTSPKEIVMHLPILCKEKNTACSFVDTKEQLGKSAGLTVATTSIAIVNEGDAKKELEEIIKILLKGKVPAKDIEKKEVPAEKAKEGKKVASPTPETAGKRKEEPKKKGE